MDRKSEPPRTLAQWREFEAWCRYLGDERWIPEDVGISYPDDYVWPEGVSGVGWFSTAEDHPFKGTEFCWRCIAEAQSYPLPAVVPHRRETGTICWGPPARDEASGHTKQDAGEAEDRAAFDRGFGPEFDPEAAAVTDTGTIFHEARCRPFKADDWKLAEVPEYETLGQRIKRALRPDPVAVHIHPHWREGPDGKPVLISASIDASAAEPVQADLSEREAQHDAQPVQAHQAEDEDRKPGEDEEA